MKLTLQKLFPLLGVVLTVYLGIILAQTVKHNYDLKNQITALEKKVDQLNAEQDELNYKVQYYQTESFKEKEARAKLGLQVPGEGVIYLPKPQAAADASATKPTKSKTNLGQWWQFIFG